MAEVADHCARLGRRLLPEAAAPELDVVRQLAVTIERDAQADPPTAVASLARRKRGSFIITSSPVSGS